MSNKLTPKQALFCKEYMVDFNATQAAIRAGYSKNSAGEMGYENLNKPQIQENLSKAMSERVESLDLTVDGVLQDILDTRDVARVNESLSERLKANEMLGKYLKMWNDKVEVTADINIIYADKDDEDL